MSCAECEAAQAGNFSAFFRWGRAKIEVRACHDHLSEVFKVLRFWQTASHEGKVGLLLHPESWTNLFKCIRKSNINSEGNFWAAIQELERQLEEYPKVK